MTTLLSAPRLVFSAPSSGSGKTTVTSVVAAALRARGLSVAPFKAGPDYLDPTHLERAAGAAARNLDGFLLPPRTLEALFARTASKADVSLIEGVMGLFDGRDAASDEASTAELARRLRAPVVLVIDAWGAARSVAATALGFRNFAPDLELVGVILNRVGSGRHAHMCETALEQVGVRSFGYLERGSTLALPERHLGLVGALEHPLDPAVFARAAATLDLEGLLEAAHAAGPLEVDGAALPLPRPRRARIGVAWDEAFHFYYPDALEALEAAGAELVRFSPLRDAALPEVGALYFGGGYPELHAAALEANRTLRAAVRDFAATGRPVVGECGGLMYLGRSLSDPQGQVFEMTGVTPLRSRMTGRLTLGYREVVALHDSPLAQAGQTLRGHEFHYSVLEDPSPRPAYRAAGGQQLEGYASGSVLASYLHLHFAGAPDLARRFVETAS
ncbi:cobyrinic acid a,c-diamide synthase [Deinobacterium chartae]|uniref:Cobyrinate a,c-diamide synthase n=1 Tax=Deinobacterium chartae TaxID=521158 RepID=A0A841I300_9DEIO|nr:cobyrinate a,c-diamide synthase [Deinobacterium chartae]MBB6098295.1 cobyrinic acid a,c-diamide synthase [Deinobacterium chartae]